VLGRFAAFDAVFTSVSLLFPNRDLNPANIN